MNPEGVRPSFLAACSRRRRRCWGRRRVKFVVSLICLALSCTVLQRTTVQDNQKKHAVRNFLVKYAFCVQRSRVMSKEPNNQPNKGRPKRAPDQTSLTISLPKTLKKRIYEAAQAERRAASPWLVFQLERLLESEEVEGGRGNSAPTNGTANARTGRRGVSRAAHSGHHCR